MRLAPRLNGGGWMWCYLVSRHPPEFVNYRLICALSVFSTALSKDDVVVGAVVRFFSAT